jgi:hypothetical protein
MRRRSDSAAVGVHHFTIDHKSIESPASHASNLAERMMMFDTPESPERQYRGDASKLVPRDISPDLASLVRGVSGPAAPGGPPPTALSASASEGKKGVSKFPNLATLPTVLSPPSPISSPEPERRPSESESSAFVTMHLPDPPSQPQNRPR